MHKTNRVFQASWADEHMLIRVRSLDLPVSSLHTWMVWTQFTDKTFFFTCIWCPNCLNYSAETIMILCVAHKPDLLFWSHFFCNCVEDKIFVASFELQVKNIFTAQSCSLIATCLYPLLLIVLRGMNIFSFEVSGNTNLTTTVCQPGTIIFWRSLRKE